MPKEGQLPNSTYHSGFSTSNCCDRFMHPNLLGHTWAVSALGRMNYIPNESTCLVKQIELGDLGTGRVPGVPCFFGKFFEQAAVVRLELQDHVPGVTLKVH